MTAVTSSPKKYLLSWREILETLQLPNDPESRRRVRDLNRHFEGPITLPARGGQPKVCSDSLLEWWDSLEDQFRERQQTRIDQKATLAASYQHGRDGTVLPDIAGHVQKRRQT